MKFEFDVPESSIYDEFMKVKDKKIQHLQEALARADARNEALLAELQTYDSCAGCWHRTLDGPEKSCFNNCDKPKKHKP